MATLYPFTKPTENKEKTDWYTVDKNQDKILKYDITEIAIVSEYTPTGNEVRWDASVERDDSVMAYITGTKVTLVLPPLTTIPERMFDSFLSLEKITGLGDVTKVEKLAFFRCFSLKDIDLDPAKLTSIGNDAFRLSCVEDILNLSNLPANAVIGERATRAKRWGNELANIQAVPFPTNKIFFDVPNPDSQVIDKYKSIPFADFEKDLYEPVLYNGCSVFTLYHTWNCLYAGSDKVYSDMQAWWDATLNKGDNYYGQFMFDSDEFWQYNTSTLGWEYDRYDSDTNQSVISFEQLQAILDELSRGLPVNTTILTGSSSHNILIIGCDPETKKLAFVDSGARKDTGAIYWCAFEDVYTQSDEGGSECIRLMDYNVPMLAEKDTWYTQDTRLVGQKPKRATITEIEIVQSYEQTGSETASWDASAEKNESVMAYLNGTKLTIAGNGYRLIYANPDSRYAFSDEGATDYFSTVTSFNGGELLNTSKATNMADMFNSCAKLKTVNVSNWDVSNVTSMYRMFRSKTSFMALDSLDVSRWDVSSCTEMSMMFQRCDYLKSLDVSNWDTSNVTRMMNMFNMCGRLKHLDVSKWDTSSCSGQGLFGVFQFCTSLKELNLSNWDMSQCEDTGFIFAGMNNLQKITLGDKFTFTTTYESTPLDAPSAEYIPYADGYWYDYDYNAYAPADIPNNVARTYYASKFIAADDDDEMVFVRNGTLRKLAVALRHKNGTIDAMLPAAFGDEVLAKAESENSLVSGTVQDYYNDRIEHIGRSLGYNTSLISVRFPNVKSMEMCAFSGCMNLVQVDMPALMYVADSAFADCMQLAQIDLPEVESIDMESFKGCMNLSTLILRNTFADHVEEVCVLVDVNAFRDTPIASGTGYIYVPDDLVEQYKGADNWSTFASQIRPISELEE